MLVVRLPDSISSPQDLRALIVDIKCYTTWFRDSVIKQKRNARQHSAAPIISAAATELLQTWSDKHAITEHSLEQLIESLEHVQSKAPTLTITLAAPPTNGLKRDLTAWCREHLSPKILVTFEFNATLLGGMVVRVGSHIYDWSFRRKILENRSHFPEVLRRV
jgi:F0F1-type ATP synthase delta subunit